MFSAGFVYAVYRQHPYDMPDIEKLFRPFSAGLDMRLKAGKGCWSYAGNAPGLSVRRGSRVTGIPAATLAPRRWLH